MKLFKKTALMLLLGLSFSTTIFAQTNELPLTESSSIVKNANNEIKVTVENGYSSFIDIPTDNILLFDNFYSPYASYSKHDLSAGNYSTQAQYSSSISVQREFSNHGGQIKVKITNTDTDRDHSVKVKLYKNGVHQQSSDLSIGKKVLGIFNSKTATFSNLDAGSNYTIQLVNQSSGKVTYNQSITVSK
ncbi:hypothetical protein [Zhenhengia yiwuensis]|jgi:hypothetical protein|uniref:Uncharacterized protein n=1 Tax=Zhenhengia yiwuensis TaxID=2763666 RepID=A0A926IFZ3_9FIRM|nr:hypothetical protein [Zhenhengia yiwuensis]MBC8581393.1 hypothetical protein [Zhenhengia yiwuensis]